MDYYVKRNIFPNDFDWAFREERYDIVEYLHKHGIISNQHLITSLIRTKNSKALKWLKEHQYFPDYNKIAIDLFIYVDYRTAEWIINNVSDLPKSVIIALKGNKVAGPESIRVVEKTRIYLLV